ncbi:MAG TPA: hypothetical protein VHJ17_25700 [Thermomonospora sp.]|nr:hypothetical protein [Thermomonospora sp.]
MPEPVTQRDYQRVLELHGQGLSRNEIARRVGRSGSTVSRLARELGLSFENGGKVRSALKAAQAYNAARRAELARTLLDDALRLRRRLWEPSTVHAFGGRDNTFTEARLDEPPYRDKREIMAAVGIAVDKSLRLDEYDSDGGVEEARSLLTALAEGLRRAAPGDEPDARR